MGPAVDVRCSATNHYIGFRIFNRLVLTLTYRHQLSQPTSAVVSSYIPTSNSLLKEHRPLSLSIRGVVPLRYLRQVPPPNIISTVVKSVQNLVNSVTLWIILNAKTEKIVLVTLRIQIEWLYFVMFVWCETVPRLNGFMFRFTEYLRHAWRLCSAVSSFCNDNLWLHIIYRVAQKSKPL